MLAEEIIERHMRELQDSLATLVADRTIEHTQHIEALQNEVIQCGNTIDILRQQNREIEALNASMKRQLWLEKEGQGRSSPIYHSSESRVVCLIDGDGCLFSFEQLARGYYGGAHIAKRLTEGLQQFFAAEQCLFHVWVFLNTRGVSCALHDHGYPEAAANLSNFIHGFNQASHRFMIVDVGPGKEAADVKIRGILDEELKSPQTRRVVLAGCHDGGYVSVIREHATNGLTDGKLFLLPTHKKLAAGYGSLSLPTIRVPDVFDPQRLESGPRPVAPQPRLAVLDDANIGRVASPALLTPAATPEPTSDISAVQRPPSSAGRSPGHVGRASPCRAPRAIDPSKPITKQDPPACYFFYVAKSCKHGAKCVHNHEYELSAEHVAQLKEAAEKSKSPCPTVNRGETCAHGDDCVWAHKCAYAQRCQYYRAGRCRFMGPGMHSAE
ncbi:hypothetical protein PHLGIDRAFT_131517 [Phlebiopsis gigantea 11061_1 CR5-6]|uniref:C3H1-type domain-containing protein n=1 Tax=Phlebiopsis gigantea (strain 11061_1 CR5-6) TaxID=745531 RepID=A0A0C3SFT4_PHLG1|nr:hypothetical protein PHLGIDRAFT_131517 [Phlebiopsis gigantea 11061_1 CR5-6]